MDPNKEEPVSKELDLNATSPNSEIDDDAPIPQKKGLRFWLIIVSLLVSTFLAALDLTAIATALPTIAEQLNSTDYTWIGSAYSICSTAFIPWSGGLADIFGRRNVLLGAVLFFAVGSAMCGAAPNMEVMIAGRSMQGVGSGAILSLVEIILADLVSLSERGAYQGAFGAIWALASATGPLIGGGLAETNWRWLFYLNLPLCLIISIVIGAFIKLKTPEGTMADKFKRMDWFGNFVFIPSITLFIVGLVYGGQTYPWTDAHVLAPLIIGFLGLVFWVVIEHSFVKHPTVPFKLLSNPTTLIGFWGTFIQAISALSFFYYWPAFFQSVFSAGPVESAIDFFSVAFVVAPFAMIAGGSISATQVYKPQNVIAWIFMTLGPGLMSLVMYDSPKKVWVSLPIPFSIGIGLLFAATVFPVLAPLPPKLAGRALAFLVFVRSFGNVLGITVGSVTLANELSQRLPAEFVATLPGGISGAFAAIPLIERLAEPLKTEVQIAFAQSIRTIWFVLIPFGAFGLIPTLFMKTYKLGTVTDETWGMREKKVAVDSEDSDRV